ncbi:hypothetical protein BH11PAT3_BH11PAT3_2600 [soil metagenome]
MENPKRIIAPVELSEPNEKWIERFEEAKIELENAVGNYAKSIEHMGSTSISNLSAKPEIDILIGLDDLSDAEKCVEPLKEIGYPYYKRFEENTPDRRYFRKSEGITPLVHVHMYEILSATYKDHILFRDTLRAHPKIAKQYENLKKMLLEASGGDRGVYQAGKAEFIQKVIDEAKS